MHCKIYQFITIHVYSNITITVIYVRKNNPRLHGAVILFVDAFYYHAVFDVYCGGNGLF